MARSRPFRFGVLALEAASSSSRDAWVSYARKVEDLGYSTLVMGEHISFGGLAPFPALMAAADATTRLRVATHSVGFERDPECTGSPYVRKNDPASIPATPTCETAR